MTEVPNKNIMVAISKRSFWSKSYQTLLYLSLVQR
jgi:hypothetical protein